MKGQSTKTGGDRRHLKKRGGRPDVSTCDEQLSAYLDGQLGPTERARLEAQLATDPTLRAELEALQRTVALVRMLSRAPLPRNFLLPQMVKAVQPRGGSTAKWSLYLADRLTWFAAATAAVAAMLVVVVTGHLLLARPAAAPGPLTPPIPVPGDEAPVEETKPVEMPMAGTEEMAVTPEVRLFGVPPTPTAESAIAPTDEISGVPMIAEAPSLAPRQIPTESKVLPDLETPHVPGTLSPSPSVEEPHLQVETYVTEPEVQGEVAAPPPLVVSPEQSQGPRVTLAEPSRSFELAGVWLALEVGLGVLLAILAVATVLAWRAQRK